ncbi:TonB-dependent receptor [Mucilaginibacter sp. HC2]|uniref:TonB-dependent receptor n=1 Tax=Mucilaginibacter inviolabilis TaxID=2714892 RepID=UPI0014092E31|nr:TonB-dependent receptor [Mucilaginibacter inviolabilis]NHA05152.1 TonB-dependent receptor [Mucilaginibacter inviolabilis]
MHKLYIIVWTLVILAMTPLWASAQETGGGLTGKVLDAAGQPLPGATISAVHQPSGTRYATVSDKDGRYHLNGLRIGGPYQLTVSMIGMNTQVKDALTVTLGDPLLLNVVLTDNTKALSEVVVKATRSGAKANTYGAGQNINQSTIRNMPSISRSIQDITRLVPQSTKDNSFAGTSFRYNNVTIDGAINNDAIGFSPSIGGQTGSSGMPGSSTRTNPVSLDAIQDMQVYIAPFDVKIGNFTGGSINAVTRSGTNEITGSVYALGRNAAITGPDRVGTAGKLPSDFHDYQTGFRVGFPIIKNKLFFFTNEEITRRTDPVLQAAGTAESAGILSLQDAENIRNATIKNYGFDPGTAGQYNTYSNSNKFFNRIDWNIDDNNQLVIRNNTITSKAINLERDQQDFRFGSIAYQQVNNQTSTVAELKSRISNSLSNSAVAGFTFVHDYRNPSSDPSIPQVQIAGETPGTTIYLGTDREASIFNQKQRTIEFTDNLTWNLGKHTFTFGTHNEFYNINYGFVNSWNGRIDYLSIQDYLNNSPYRVRGSYNYTDDTRDYILNNPVAKFNINLYSVYAQDEIQISDRFKITPGIRLDYADVPDKQLLSTKSQNANHDPYFGTTYLYTPLYRITNSYFSSLQISPRLGFRYDWLGNQSLIFRGGAGLFTGRIPFAWLGYTFYNNGDSYGAYDRNSNNTVFTGNPLQGGANGIGKYISQNGVNIIGKNASPTQVDVVDNHFKMPRVARINMAVDYTDQNQFKYTVEGILTKTIQDVVFRQINVQDNPTYYGYDVKKQQPIFSGSVDPTFTNVYEMSNTSQGYRYSLTGTVSRNFSMGFNFSASYTYGKSKDVSNGIRNSLESNWQLNQALNPNNPGLANSNFDIRNRIVINAGYHKAWNERWISNFSLFFSAQSGSPFTYGLVNNSIQGLGQQVSLLYIPKMGETINFFQDYTNGSGQVITAVSQANAFDNYINSNKYLSSRRGDFTERNTGRTPWNNQADFHFAQEYHFSKSGKQYLTFSADIINLTNLLNKNWGISYFSPNTFNSTASIGLTPAFPARQNPGNYPVYQFQDPGKSYSVDYFNSRYQVQLGARYTF